MIRSRRVLRRYDTPWSMTHRFRLGIVVNNGRGRGDNMIVLGIILLVLGWLLAIQILWTLGIILIVIGVILELLGAIGRPVMGRRHYW
jgi:Family of unknown function (DUF6131)